MEYLEYIFEASDQNKKEILLAMLDNIGFEGFEETGQQLIAYVKPDQFDEILFNNIIEESGILFSKSTIKNINWNEKWEAGFEPVLVTYPGTVNPFVAVRANFHEAVKDVKFDLVITPKMSFGTGHHATTYLMISQMSSIDLHEKLVVDFGTGTGVLAILAEKMGAREVIAIDHDEWSIRNTLENVEANACQKIKVIQAGSVEAIASCDVLLANINLNIIIENIHAINAACKPGAVVLFSGILKDDEEKILQVLKQASFLIKQVTVKDNWLVICTITQ